MGIGEKIKSIRTSKLLTQKQLAGEQITRNMLSRIENGAALPSLQTIYYLASRLNISPGFLLAEGEDEQMFRKIYKIGNIRHAYKNGDYRICRDLCMESGVDDDEIHLILADCGSQIAKEEFSAGRLRTAGRYFEESVEHAGKSIYGNGTYRAQASIYFRYMKGISPTLGGDIGGGTAADGLAFGDPFCLYAVALEREGECKDAQALGSGPHQTLPRQYGAHIAARGLMRAGEHREAADLLSGILGLQSATSEPFLYNVFCDLEICSRESGDFKGAYEYSAVKVNLLERLLTEADA